MMKSSHHVRSILKTELARDEKRMILPTNKKLIFVLFGVLFVALASAPTLYFYSKYQSLKKKVQTQESVEEQMQALVTKVGRHILLPEGETPTIFTVTEKDKLSGQTFFANAKNGDKVIIYSNAKRAFLYDPVADKILEAGPVLATESTTVAGSQTITPASKPTPASVRFVLLNGTTTVGLTRKYEVELKQKVPSAQVLDYDNARKRDYEKTILVDLSTTKGELARQLAQFLGIAVGQLPSGEVAPKEADFLIILGGDKK